MQRTGSEEILHWNAHAWCAVIIRVLCLCMCVCCAQDVQTHLHNIYYTHASGCVNQHEGMFMCSVRAKYCVGKERLKLLQVVHKRVVEE